MFVDDILCVGETKLSKWAAFHKIFMDFGKSYGIYIKKDKTELITVVVDDPEVLEIVVLFGIKIHSLIGGFKYLGCFLNPSKYLLNDWEWLLS